MTDVRRSYRVVTAPLFEPVSLAEAKAWLKVEHDDENALIELLIGAARERAESITGRMFVERTIEIAMDDLPDGDAPIELLCSPVQSVSYIRYLDSSGTAQEMSGSPDQWILDTVCVPSRIAPLDGESWPDTNGGIANVRIGLICGYAPSGSPTDETAYQAALPRSFRLWMQTRLATFYEHREQIVVGGQVVDIPRDYVDGLLDGLIANRRFA